MLEVWQFLEQFDLIMLQETWLEKDNETRTIDKLSKAYRWTTKAAKRSNTKGRASGGQIVGIRKRMSEKWRVEEWDFGLIVKIQTKERAKERWIIPVYNNVGIGKIEKPLTELIEDGTKNGAGIIIIGDLNARIGKEQANGEEEGNRKSVPSRNSEDTTVNAEGKKLLRMCEKMGLTILNGRKKGDEEGKLTYVGGGGASSVLDLIIELEDEEEDTIESMKVVPRIESDHLPVTMNLNVENNSGVERSNKRTKTKKRGQTVVGPKVGTRVPGRTS